MPTSSTHHQTILRRKRRTRAALAHSLELPRLSVHRSLRHIYAQIIDDNQGKTLASTHDFALEVKGGKTEVAAAVGAKIAELALAAKVKAVRFDRGSYKYHGRVAALAEAARKGGLKF
jgi:large subunit ribosomal protein L18